MSSSKDSKSNKVSSSDNKEKSKDSKKSSSSTPLKEKEKASISSSKPPSNTETPGAKEPRGKDSKTPSKPKSDSSEKKPVVDEKDRDREKRDKDKDKDKERDRERRDKEKEEKDANSGTPKLHRRERKEEGHEGREKHRSKDPKREGDEDEAAREERRRRRREREEREALKEKGEGKDSGEEIKEKKERHHDRDKEKRREDKDRDREKEKREKDGDVEKDKDPERKSKLDRAKEREEKMLAALQKEKEASAPPPSLQWDMKQGAPADDLQSSDLVTTDIAEPQQENTAPRQSPHEGDDYYVEDDFEDYEEDFEAFEDDENNNDGDEVATADPDHEQRHDLRARSANSLDGPKPKMDASNLQALQLAKAMEEENARILKKNEKQSVIQGEDTSSIISQEGESFPSSTGPRPKKQSTTANSIHKQEQELKSTKRRMNFGQSAASQHMAKAATRAKDLSRLIELDTMSFMMLDLPPVREYDLYIKRYGSSNAHQTASQTNEDSMEAGIQTEVIEKSTRWTQHPPSDFKGFGQEKGEEGTHDNSSLLMSPDEESGLQGENLASQLSQTSEDYEHLNSFLRRAGGVVLSLLDEPSAPAMAERRAQGKGKSSSASSLFQDGGVSFASTMSLFAGRCVLCIERCALAPDLILTAFSPPPPKTQEAIKMKGFLCVWNSLEPAMPQKILVCEGQPSCCMFSTTRAYVVVAGLDDGSVVLWDLREGASQHGEYLVGGVPYTLRRPTYSTAGLGPSLNHGGAVVAVCALSSLTSSRASSFSSEEEKGSSVFQFASLDSEGLLRSWVVTDVSISVGLDRDLGLAPGGKMKIVNAGETQVIKRHDDVFENESWVPLSLVFHPNDATKFLVGSNMGIVYHGNRFHSRPSPRSYLPMNGGIQEASSIQFSPNSPSYFLAGFSSGEVSLFRTDFGKPVATWEVFPPAAILAVTWSASRACVFYVLDALSRLHVWDLLENEMEPVVVEQLKGEGGHGKGVKAISVCSFKSPLLKPVDMILAYESGSLEGRFLTERFNISDSEEKEAFRYYLSNII